MKRRAFLAAAGPLVAMAVPDRLLAAVAGGGVVAVVTADLESHLVAVDTTSGRIVKRIYADELPQIVNVLRGEMSFVGPRPCDRLWPLLKTPPSVGA